MIVDLHTGHETMATRPEQQQVAGTMNEVEYVLSGGEESPALLMVQDSHSPRSDGSIIVNCSPRAEAQAQCAFWVLEALQFVNG